VDDVLDDWPEPDFDSTELEARHDPKVDEAAVKLLGFIEENPGEVFYEMQLEVIFERDYFQLDYNQSPGPATRYSQDRQQP
jgi:hypothetical protein